MNNSLSDIYYSKVFITEKNALESSPLQNPGNDELGSLPDELFGEVPKINKADDPTKIKGIDKAKNAPTVKQTTGTSSKLDVPKGGGKKQDSMPNSAPAKSPSVSKGTEMEDTEVDPTDDEDESEEKETEQNSKKKQHNLKEENFNMSAFERLFKKTINEQEDPEMGGEVGDTELEGEGPNDALDLEDEQTEGETEEEEADLISDLRELSDKLNDILSKLEGTMEEEESAEEGEGDYSENDFDSEFGGEEGGEEQDEEGMQTESKGYGALKPLSNSKGKKLQGKGNKVSKIKPKGGKAHTGKLTNSPEPKALGDKKKVLQSKGNKVSSSLKQGQTLFD